MGLSNNIVLTGYHERRHNNDHLGNGPRIYSLMLKSVMESNQGFSFTTCDSRSCVVTFGSTAAA